MPKPKDNAAYDLMHSPAVRAEQLSSSQTSWYEVLAHPSATFDPSASDMHTSAKRSAADSAAYPFLRVCSCMIRSRCSKALCRRLSRGAFCRKDESAAVRKQADDAHDVGFETGSCTQDRGARVGVHREIVKCSRPLQVVFALRCDNCSTHKTQAIFRCCQRYLGRDGSAGWDLISINRARAYLQRRHVPHDDGTPEQHILETA